MTSPSRPVLRWHGGKWLLAPWIISHFPRHRIYVEPFGGAASVLLRKKTVFSEIYNDLDGEVVSLFRVLRNREQAGELVRLLELTPFAREEFDQSYEAADCIVERARRLIVRSYMGFGSDSAHTSGTTGFRAQSPQSCRSPEKDWRNYPAKLSATIERLRDVVIENRPATEIMSRHDSDETLHYVDPPYLPETRSKKSRRGGASYHSYRFELTTDDHTDLLSYLLSLKGMVVLSGYPSALYDDALAGWHRIEKNTFADGAAKRVEVLWLNPVCFERLQRRALPLLHHMEAAE